MVCATLKHMTSQFHIPISISVRCHDNLQQNETDHCHSSWNVSVCMQSNRFAHWQNWNRAINKIPEHHVQSDNTIAQCAASFLSTSRFSISQTLHFHLHVELVYVILSAVTFTLVSHFKTSSSHHPTHFYHFFLLHTNS